MAESSTLTHTPLLKRAQAVRVREHHLRPVLRLRTKGQVYDFIRQQGLVSVLGGNELPSLISAVLGKPWKPSKKGFTGWLDWWSVKISGRPLAQVSSEIEGGDDILATRLFRRTKTFVSKKIWPTLDPIVKHQRALVEEGEVFSELERLLLKTIEKEGSIRTDRLRKMLKLEAKENNSRFHRALTNLESGSLIVGVEDPRPETHLHANLWQAWQRRTRGTASNPRLTYEKAIDDLLEKTIHSCVLAPEDQVAKWFPWSKDLEAAVRRLLDQGRIIGEGSFLVSTHVARKQSPG